MLKYIQLKCFIEFDFLIRFAFKLGNLSKRHCRLGRSSLYAQIYQDLKAAHKCELQNNRVGPFNLN